MPTAEVSELPELPPTVNVKARADKFREAMAKGVPTAPVAPAVTPDPPAPVVVAPATSSIVPEAKAPEAPKPEVKQAETKPTKIPSEQFKILEKQRDDFRTQSETHQSKIKDLEAKLTAATTTLSPEMDAKMAKLAEYEAIVDQIYIERSPQFKKHYDEARDQALLEASDAVGTEHKDKIAKILKAPAGDWRDQQVEALGEELSAFKQGGLIKAYTDLRRVERERDAQLSKASENVGKLQEFEQQRAKESDAKEVKASDDAFVAEIAKPAFVEFHPIDGNTEHNARVEKNRALAHKFVTSKLPPDERARLALYAVKGFNSFETDAVRDSLIGKLQKQIKDMQAANPSLVPTGGNKQETPTPEGFVAKMKRAMSEGVPKE